MDKQAKILKDQVRMAMAVLKEACTEQTTQTIRVVLKEVRTLSSDDYQMLKRHYIARGIF